MPRVTKQGSPCQPHFMLLSASLDISKASCVVSDKAKTQQETQPLLPLALSHPEVPTHSLSAAFPTASQDGALPWSPSSCPPTEYQDDPISAVFSSQYRPTTVYIRRLLWKLHSRAFRPCRQNMANTASLDPHGHMPSTLGTPSALPGSLCVPGTGLTGRGTPDLANTCLHALQVDPGPSRGQELLPVPGAQGGCWLGGQGTRLSPPLLPPRELLVKLPPEDAPTKPLLPKFRSALPGARGACA